MFGQVGFMIGIKEDVMELMIDFVKNVEFDYGSIFVIFEVEVVMCEMRMKKIKIVCMFCGVGCFFEVWIKGWDILKIQFVFDVLVNVIFICVKGKFGWDFVNFEEWIIKFLICKNGVFVEFFWEEVFDFVVSRLGLIKEQYGKGFVGFIFFFKIMNEENYVI